MKIYSKGGYYINLIKLRYPVNKLLNALVWDVVGKIINNKKRLEEFYYKPARYIAYRDYGLKFPGSYPIVEMFVEKIYTQYNDFIPKPGDIIVDVGAQYGDYAILCAKYYKAKVFAFEPLKSNFRIIKSNIKFNKLNKNSINAYNFALGAESKKIEISFDNDMMNSLNTTKKQRTSVKTLDTYSLKPDILKIDVEGFEMDVLKGAVKTIKRHHPKIILEVHTKALKEQCIKFLSYFGYKIVHYGRIMRPKDIEFDEVQNLFLY
jgi:FkbM family methyltransferase